MGGKSDNKERDFNREHPFPTVSGHKRRNDIKEVDVTEYRMYIILNGMDHIHDNDLDFDVYTSFEKRLVYIVR